MGYLAPPDDGAVIEIEIRGAWVAGERVDPPFIDQ
jgi:hypothetical protein